MSISRASSAARFAACAGVSPRRAGVGRELAGGVRARRALARSTRRTTSMVSTSRRSISPTAGGRSTAAVPNASVAREPRSAGSGPPRLRRSAGSRQQSWRGRRRRFRKASCTARAARRVGSSSVMPGRSSGSGCAPPGCGQIAVQDRRGRTLEKRAAPGGTVKMRALLAATNRLASRGHMVRPRSQADVLTLRSTFRPRSALPACRRASKVLRGARRRGGPARSPGPTAG